MRQRSQLQLDWVPVDAYDKTRANAFEENARMCDTQSLHMRQHVQIANAFQANAHKENASMYDTQYFGVYETTYANAFEEMQECTKPNILMHLRPHVQTLKYKQEQCKYVQHPIFRCI